MFGHLHTIFNTSKIDKTNTKNKQMQNYIESLKKTQVKQQQQLEKIKKLSTEITQKVNLDNSYFIDEKINNIQSSNNTSETTFINDNFHLDTNKINSFFSNLEDLKIENTVVPDFSFLQSKMNTNQINGFLSNIKDNFLTTNFENNIYSLEQNTFNFNYLLDNTQYSNKKINDNDKIPTNTNIQHNTRKTIDFSILNKLNSINFVYQQKYKNKFVTGFGDFLRGCYFILEFSQKCKVNANIIILHPIKDFLKNKTNIIPKNIADNIDFCEYINHISNQQYTSYNPDTSALYYEFFTYLNKQPINNKQLFIYTICYPTSVITEESKRIIQHIIDPVDEIKINIDKILTNLHLTKHQFIILHIRSGDQYLNKTEKQFSSSYGTKLIETINQILVKNENYLLIADNIFVKNIIIKHFPSIKTYFKPITHLGENTKLDNENIKNTLIDFYIISYSKSVYNISSYHHGSGFSMWASLTYNIPYQSYKIL
jgi:hypothetical protein